MVVDCNCWKFCSFQQLTEVIPGGLLGASVVERAVEEKGYDSEPAPTRHPFAMAKIAMKLVTHKSQLRVARNRVK